MSPDPRILSWHDVEVLTVRLARQIEQANVDYDVFLGLCRGGMHTTLLLAQVFDRGLTLTAQLKRYADGATDSNARPRLISFPDRQQLHDRRVLIIDEVADRGDSLVEVVDRVQACQARQVDTAVLHFKPDRNRHPDFRPTYFVEETADWIVYPWEVFAKKVRTRI